MSRITALPRRLLMTLLIAVTVIGFTGTAASQPNQSSNVSSANVVDSTVSSYRFQCEPGSVPQSSIFTELGQELRVFLDRSYLERFPDECVAVTRHI